MDEPLRSMVAKMALNTYRGENCRFCEKPLESDEDMHGAVFTGYATVAGKLSRVSHKACWDAADDRSVETLSENERATRLSHGGTR